MNEQSTPNQPAPSPTPPPTAPVPPLAAPAPAPSPNLAPASTPATSQPAGQTVIVKKSSPWPWIVGGCLFIILLVIGSIVFVGWWGARKIKNEMKKLEPTVENVKNNIDKMSKEAEEWEKKSQEMRESLPNAEDFSPGINNSE